MLNVFLDSSTMTHDSKSACVVRPPKMFLCKKDELNVKSDLRLLTNQKVAFSSTDISSAEFQQILKWTCQNRPVIHHVIVKDEKPATPTQRNAKCQDV